ncbi:hypothetical protein Javan249_0045 [Streptococcus phage Javan249]|uniref:hypothetical protein n=1 Tax=Streptococcus halotolerans TaxID=1814128 RepID=UPI0007879C94|nr:hypothetical protein [Streptococcus halotolerans]QBX16411.1 hypothetical protein Javan249_0045 [Streptococcus phage Javan249]
MNENIQSKLAIEIASKSITIATLESQNEELQSQLNQYMTKSQSDDELIKELKNKLNESDIDSEVLEEDE